MSSGSNPWLSWSYVRENTGEILAALREHATLTCATVLIAVVIALPLAVLAHRVRWLSGIILALSGVLYGIPSLALFALLAPYAGITARTVLIGLVSYALLVLIRSTLTGLRQVPDDALDAARGMGYGSTRRLLAIELPLALPGILTGIRLATVGTVALTTVGVIAGHGGLGQLIIGGFRNNFHRAEITTGTLLCVALALALDGLIAGLGRLAMPWSRR